MPTTTLSADVPTISARARLRLWAWRILVAFIVAGMLFWLIATRSDLVLSDPLRLYAGWSALGASVLLVGSLLATTPVDAVRLSRRTSGRVILLGTLVMHGTCLVVTWPALSDDVIRYRFDGRQWLHGLNAYRQTPAEQALTANADAIDRLVPHATTHTAYLPTSQLYFAAVATIESVINPDVDEPKAQLWRPALREMDWLDRAGVWRAAAFSLVLLCALLLLRVLRLLDRSPWWSTLFLWHPLTLVEVTGNGHQDVAGIALLLLCIFAARSRVPVASALTLAAAAFVKPIALAVVLVGWQDGRRSRIRFVATLAAGVAVLLAVVSCAGGDAFAGAWQRYSRTWEFNGPLFDFTKWVLIDGLGREPDLTKQRIRQWSVIALIATFAWCVWRRRDALDAAALLLTVACLLSPVLYPWYLLWPLAVIAVGTPSFRWTVLTWSTTSVFSYAVLHEPEWLLPRWAIFAEFTPVAVAACIDVLSSRQRSGARNLS